jgi:hypothetical protein
MLVDAFCDVGVGGVGAGGVHPQPGAGEAGQDTRRWVHTVTSVFR